MRRMRRSMLVKSRSSLMAFFTTVLLVSLGSASAGGEVARIAREKLNPYGCDLVVHRMADRLTRFLIEVQSTGRRYDLIKSFFHHDRGSIQKTE